MGKAIVAIKDRRGCSRSAIARWIQINLGKESGSTFNAALRSALKKGIESGLFKEGNSKQRFNWSIAKGTKEEGFVKEKEACIQEEVIEEERIKEEEFFQEESGNQEESGDEEEKLVKEEE